MIAIRTRTTRQRFSRRAFLRSVGASAAMVPLLSTERARAVGPNGSPKRIITIAWGNGVAQPAFYPPGDDPTANTIMQPLAALKSKVTMVSGLDYKHLVDTGHLYDGHFSFPTMFTGTYKNLGGQRNAATGISIDQVVSDAVAKQVNLPMPVLPIQIAGLPTSYRADGTRNTAETQPQRLFATLFANRTMPAGQVNTLALRRKSVLDYLTQDLGGFGNRLGSEDRAKIASHLESIRKLETQLAAGSTAPSCSGAMDPGNVTDYPGMLKAFNDLVAMALRCDVTRAVSMSWAGDGGSPPDALPVVGVSDCHGVAHQGAGGYAQKIKVDTWYISQLAYLATALNAVTEGDGTVLDNSLIVMANDMTEGSFHSVTSVPIVLVGGAGGALKTGRNVLVGSWQGKTGNYWSSGKTNVPHNQLLATISNLFDIPATSFGTMYGGTLTSLA
jgi:hypothetical protein